MVTPGSRRSVSAAARATYWSERVVEGRSAAAVDDDQVGEHPGGEARGQHDEPELAVAVPAHAVPDLTDHVEDRSAREGVEDELERVGGDVVPDHRAKEGGCTADQAHQREPAPRRPHVPEG